MAFLLLLLSSCGAQKGDPPVVKDPNPLGDGLRIREVQGGAVMPGSDAHVSSAVVTAIDTFDETNDGKSRGTIYLQDADKAVALAGISLFSPSFQPSNLRLFPGDVVDLQGTYVELHKLGSTVDFGTSYLAQFDHPALTFRSEATKLPEPVVIDVTDLFDFNKARRWMGMLVTIKNVQFALGPTPVPGKTQGRVQAYFTSDTKGPGVSNELFDLKPGAFPDGATFQSVTGICTFFFSFKIAPRSQADLVQ